jgi:tellurite resistance protein TehA-like permease
VLGSQILQVGNYETVAQILWIATFAFWLLLVYAIPVAFVAQSEGKPRFQQGIQGNWLLWTVATASVSVLGTQLAPSFGAATSQIVFWSFLTWLLSVVFYLWVIVMIVQRLFFYDLTAGELYPTYWIDMGAVAIATLAGATLLAAPAQRPLIERLEPFTAGLTLLLWITATWWIPWLLAMFVWRHAVLRKPAWFVPEWWGMVFPLGMYSAATATVARALDLPVVFDDIASAFVWIALVAWVAIFVDMLITLWR